MSTKDLSKDQLMKHIHSIGLTQKEDVEEDTFDENYLDETIKQAIAGGHGQFIQGLEDFLDEFVEDKNKQTEKLNKLNKFQRKIVHKICDRYNIVRDFVEVKNDLGTMSLSKQPLTQKPQLSTMELYEQTIENEGSQIIISEDDQQGQFQGQGQFQAQPQFMMNPAQMQQMMMQQYQMQMQMMNKGPAPGFSQQPLYNQFQMPNQPFPGQQNQQVQQGQNANQSQQKSKFKNTEEEFPSL